MFHYPTIGRIYSEGELLPSSPPLVPLLGQHCMVNGMEDVIKSNGMQYENNMLLEASHYAHKLSLHNLESRY